MADFLAMNTINKIKQHLNSITTLGISIDFIKSSVDNTIANYKTNTDFQKIELEKLSCIDYLAHCLCNFCGSGTGGTVGNSPWQSLESTSIFNNKVNVYERLKVRPEMKDLVDKINMFNNPDHLINFIEMYALEVINNSSDEFKSKWNGDTNLLKVCGVNYNNGEGAICTWTVPDGTQYAKFQVWGAGAGTHPGCCCGGSSFGANGAYSELTIEVTPGDVYQLCAGCSCSNPMESNTYPGCACMSGVTGPGICCLKADGGGFANNALAYARTYLGINHGGSPSCCRFQSFYCQASGLCLCTYGYYCYSTACATCGVVSIYPNCIDRTYCACGTDTTEISKGGIRPLHGGGCLDIASRGVHYRPPILDSDTCSLYQHGCYCAEITNECCQGGCAGNVWTKHPGMGGAHSYVCGGATSSKSGTGAGGMVQVVWE